MTEARRELEQAVAEAIWSKRNLPTIEQARAALAALKPSENELADAILMAWNAAPRGYNETPPSICAARAVLTLLTAGRRWGNDGRSVFNP